jgi:phage tail-like protein
MGVQFPANSHREDPYRNFKFRVKWGGETVAGLSKMSAIKRITEVIEWREAGGTGVNRSTVRKLPGRSKMEPVTLESGLSQDRQFITWAEQVNNPQGDGNGAPNRGVSLLNYRKNVTIEVLNLQGSPVISFILERAWPSEFQALPEMDANANAVAIQVLKLEYERFSLDTSVREPAET